jgi:hypothetical protein
VIIGEDDPAARSAAEAARRRDPDRINLVTDRRRWHNVASVLDRALPAMAT